MQADFSREWSKWSKRVKSALERFLPSADAPPARLHRAMRYSVFAGGKRLRPVLCLLAGKMLGGKLSALMPPACALEMVHTYSLIHDDLPAMDDDDLRRGKPTLHRKFDEATAILAGDALLTFAFETIASRVRDKALAARLCAELASASGPAGMVGGQMFDLAGETRRPDATLVDEIHRRKTAALIRASVRMGAMAAGATASRLRDVTRFGEALGLLFQVTDDLLDVTGDAKSVGKRVGKDAGRGKQTYPAVHGIEKSRALAERLAATAEKALAKYAKRAGLLLAVPRYVIERSK